MGLFFSIFFGTFVLEDIALASAVALVAEGKLSFSAAFFAAFSGIALGDLGLYFIGAAMSRFELEKKWKFLRRFRQALSAIRQSTALSYSIVISRIVPGTRIPTYVGAGFLRYSIWKFLGLTIVSVAAWVEVALLTGQSMQALFMDHWILSIVLFLIGLRVVQKLTVRLSDRWSRKALVHAWRRWAHFEFWPSWFFYSPLVPYYVYLSLKSGSLFTPFYANPNVANGGLLGESKWDFLKHLDSRDPSTLASFRLDRNADFETTLAAISSRQFAYPFIMKPDVGQRGFGVRILRNDFDLTEYLLLSDFDRIVQRLSEFPREAGLFYVRTPGKDDGFLFSITDKWFPFIVGDGRSAVGDLILADLRARVIAPVYFERLKEKLDFVLSKGETLALSECGNHCQGAIFKNGETMISPRLTKKIDEIAKLLPDFYFGRFDVRYRDRESLQQGESFEIVEVNGAGSEATHIWDSSTRLFDAYRTLFHQWRILFSIGQALRKRPGNKSQITLIYFIRECAKVWWRKDGLTVSS